MFQVLINLTYSSEINDQQMHTDVVNSNAVSECMKKKTYLPVLI